MWLSECQPLNRNRIWHTCTQLKKCKLPHRVFDLNVTCHQEKAWSNISRAIIKCYKQLCFIHWHSLSSPFHFECLVIEIHWMWEMPQAGQQWRILFLSPQLLQKGFNKEPCMKTLIGSQHSISLPSGLETESRHHLTHSESYFLQTNMNWRKQIWLKIFSGSVIDLFQPQILQEPAWPSDSCSEVKGSQP